MASSPLVAFALKSATLTTFALAPLTYYLWGPKTCAGFCLGAATSVFSLWFASWLVARSFRTAGPKLPAISKLQLALIAKLPLFAIVIFFTNSLGMGALNGFLGGYGLVYFALVLGAFMVHDAPASTFDE